AAAEAAPEVRGFRTVEAGVTLDRYAVEAELGQGGMATVYRARDTELRRDVAVKVLFPHLARKREVVRRFSREARAAAGLEHRHILRVYDVGGGEVAGGDPPYIVMELVRGGGSLRELAEPGAQGAAVDGRSDLYSVGATLYQLATGSLPFSGPTARVVAQIVRGELTPALRRAPSIGPDLARAIERLMAIEPAQRPASAIEAAA